MELQIGSTYKSPRHAREIKIGALFDHGGSYTLAIYWLEPDLDYDEMDQITVSKEDTKDWKLVSNV